MLVEEYKRRYEGPTDHEPPRPVASLQRERERERMPRPPALPPWAPVGLVLVVIVVALYLVGTLGGGGSKSPSPAGLRAGPHRSTRPAHHHVALPATPQSVTLQLTPSAPVYVCLVNGAGKHLIFEQTYAVGQRIPTFTERKLLLTLGNANVQVKVDGKAVPVTPSTTAIRLLLTSTGVQHIPMSQKPTCP
jgi:hypothetical protein